MEDDAVVLVHQGFGWAVATFVAILAIAVLASAVAVWLVLRGDDSWSSAGGFVYLIFMPIAVVALAVRYLRRHRHDTTVLSSPGVTVHASGQTTTYRWEDMLEVGWINAEYPTLSCVLFIRMEGATWTNPGPNVPAVVRMPIYGRHNRLEAREAVRAACERHGVAFWDKAGKMLKLAPPGSRFRRDG